MITAHHAADSLAVGYHLGAPELVNIVAEQACDAVNWPRMALHSAGPDLANLFSSTPRQFGRGPVLAIGGGSHSADND